MATPPTRTALSGDPFSCEVSYRPGAWTLALFGEFDLAGKPKMDLVIAAVRAIPATAVTLDLRGLTFMDSTGLHGLITLDALSRQQGFELLVIEGNEAIRRTLTISGVKDGLHALDAPPLALAGEGPPEHAVIATDLTGIVMAWNAAAERLYGWSAHDVIGRPITELTVGPEDAGLAEQILESVRHAGTWSGEFEVRRKDGTRFQAYVHDVLISDDHDQVIGVLGVSIPAARAASAAA
jgi:anti-anti-sigma factor